MNRRINLSELRQRSVKLTAPPFFGRRGGGWKNSGNFSLSQNHNFARKIPIVGTPTITPLKITAPSSFNFPIRTLGSEQISKSEFR
ncbi:hypothetical protein A0128_05630 [Leptospira tipperaryensis]|uniref:Uncharacterized protein n=1 Tax=Leptospira tipperaryensis TaxID=2564040 RepID=A0A1D7UUT8_9LEPT|nr:hypothetical protein A0128_05630 [Leptospira tipperaryensis]